ncbi:MAG: phosphatidate cytidylyltransferase [Bacteroidetes Order II. Incertae sedis bacterium]|nr:phosphatidate cytidylyltransferase [Bacteroidetes Order II. bacterium]
MTTTPNHIPFWAELSRKAVHLSSLGISAFVWIWGAGLALKILIPLCLLFFLGDLLRAHSEPFRSFINQYFAFMMRDFELIPKKLIINGATWVLLGAVLTFSLFPQDIALASFSILILGDAFAAIIGRLYGKTPLWNTGKSIEGSIAFVLFSCMVFPFVPSIGFFALITAILFAALAEALPLPLDDNIRIPIVAGCTLWLFQLF